MINEEDYGFKIKPGDFSPCSKHKETKLMEGAGGKIPKED